MEVLGGVSSVLAVVSLALQLGSNIQKLVGFWDSVKEAPEDIHQLKSQLGVLGELLRCIEVDTRGSLKPRAADIGVQCLQVCNMSVSKLERVTAELNRGLNGNGVKRRWTCLRKTLRERQLAAYWVEVERAKSMLIMYQGWKNGQRHDSLLAMMMKLAPALAQKCASARATDTQDLQIRGQPILINESGFTKVFLGSTIYEIHLSFGTICIRISSHIIKSKDIKLSSDDLVHRRRQQDISASFIPDCFLSSVFKWNLTRGHYSQMTLKCFNLRPGWSPIFRHSAQGDINKVRELIEGGKASPYDMDEDGWTPLHVSDTCFISELVRTLTRAHI